jgi:hypothetical protein
MKGKAGFLLACLPFLIGAAAAESPHNITILRAEAKIDYPLDVTFTVEAESDSEIRVLELEYGLTGRDCTPDVNIAVPEDFSPGEYIDLEWTWRVSATGNLPPGTKIWWDWRLEDAEGNEIRTEKEWVTWIDSVHNWKTMASENILLHYYRGSEDYNREYMEAAETAREILREDIGTWPTAEINIFIYGSNKDMKDALVKEPEWIGGLSFGQNQRTIMIGIGRGEEEWGKSTISHELAHTVVDSIMGGCYASIPLWLNEGIAMEAEQFLDDDFTEALEDAIYYDTLFTLQEISYTYQYVDGDPTLTYAESHSATQYVIAEYGGGKIFQLLKRLGKGYTYDNALLYAFGVDMYELENDWRASIGADPAPERTVVEFTETPQATLPLAVPPLTVSTPTPMPELPPTATTEAPAPQANGFAGLMESPWNIAILCGFGLLCAVGIGGTGAILIMAGKRARRPARVSFE